MKRDSAPVATMCMFRDCSAKYETLQYQVLSLKVRTNYSKY